MVLVRAVQGHLRERRAGVWELVVELGRDPLSGRRRQQSRTVRGTKRQAQQALRSLIGDVEGGRLTGTATTVSDLLDQWLDLFADELSPTTLREYRRLVARRIKPALGETPLIKLTTPQLDAFYLALSRDAGLSPASVRQIHAIVRRALRQAVRWGWVEHNVAINTAKPRMRRPAITPPSVDKMHELLRDADAYSAPFGVFVRVAVATGMRRGELCGLRWRDVELDRSRIRVNQAVVAAASGTHVKSPKSGAVRSVTIDPQTCDLVAAHGSAMTARAAATGLMLVEDSYVFSHEPDGSRPWHPDSVTAVFRNLASNRGTVRLHDLRHAHATQLLAKGVEIVAVSSRLGHANTSTTLNVYAHALESRDHHAAAIIGDLLS